MNTINKLKRYSYFIIISILLSACSLIDGTGQSVINYNDITLYDGITFGQSFYAKHDGLQSFNLYLEPSEMGEGNIQVYLRKDPDSTENLDKVSINRSKINQPGYYSFEFSKPHSSYLAGFFVLIDYEGSGSLILGTADQNSYYDGAGYSGGETIPRQFAFSLSYAVYPMIKALIKVFIFDWLKWIFIAILLFVLPGTILLNFLNIRFENINSYEKLVFSIAISLSITPILFLWTNIIGLNLGIIYALIPVVFIIVFLFIKLLRNNKVVRESVNLFRSIRFDKADFVFVVLVLLLIFTRFWVIRALPLPLWGDSYQHTLITQLMYENNGLFNSWEPYAAIENFTYHFGFHANSVIFKWITNETSAQAVMVLGQILNIFAVIVLYPLAVFLSPKRNKWSGVIAVFIGGFLMNMPSFYVNWGRYTQLLGQVILIPLVLFIWKMLEDKGSSLNKAVLAGVMLAGLAFSHYRVLIIFIIFLPAYILFHVKSIWREKRILNLSIVGGIACVLFLPWFVHSFSGNMVDLFFGFFQFSQKQIAMENSTFPIIKLTLESLGLFNYVTKYEWAILILASIYFIFRRDYKEIIFLFWWFLVFVVGFPQLFHLPGKDIISGFAVLIALYIPVSVLLGVFISNIFKNPNYPIWAQKIATILLIIPIIWFAKLRISDVDPKSAALAAFPDLQAAEWIKKNMPEDAKIYINNFPAYDGTVVVGSDGGWWLPYLSGRQVSVLPINYGFEVDVKGKQKIIEDAIVFWNEGVFSEEGIELLRRNGFDFLYVGQTRGSLNSPNEYKLNDEEIKRSGLYTLIYKNDYISLYKLYDQE